MLCTRVRVDKHSLKMLLVTLKHFRLELFLLQIICNNYITIYCEQCSNKAFDIILPPPPLDQFKLCLARIFAAQHAILLDFDLHSLDSVLQLRLWVRLLESGCTQAGLCPSSSGSQQWPLHCRPDPVKEYGSSGKQPDAGRCSR